MKIRVLSIATILLTVHLTVGATPLITTKESQLPNAQGELKTRGISRGPGIRVVSPETEVKSPFDLKVQFEPRGGNKIDPTSVKVTYLKSPKSLMWSWQ